MLPFKVRGSLQMKSTNPLRNDQGFDKLSREWSIRSVTIQQSEVYPTK